MKLKRKRRSVQKALFRFVKQAVLIARKLTDCAVMQLSHPASNGIGDWKHMVLYFLRVHMEATLSEVLNWINEMERMKASLALQRCEFLSLLALYKWFD